MYTGQFHAGIGLGNIFSLRGITTELRKLVAETGESDFNKCVRELMYGFIDAINIAIS